MVSTWPFLTIPSRSGVGHWHHHLDSLSDYCLAEAVLPERPTWSSPLPRSFGKERYFLHLFSGRRRDGDFQSYFDQMHGSPPGVVLHVISLDIVLSEEWGDLQRPATRKFWLEAIRSKYVIGLLGGPPCETWSQARERNISLRGRLPRVLRTAAQPWGCDALRLRELRQLCFGNSLMGFQLEAVVELFCTGGLALTEHPAPPKSETSVSICAHQFCSCFVPYQVLSLFSFLRVFGVPNPPNPPVFSR